MPRGGSNATPPCEKHHITDCIACAAIGKTKAVEPPVHPAYSDHNPEEWIEQGSEMLDEVQAAIGVQPRSPIKVEAGRTEAIISFDILPVDDSKSSKITRAAAAYARASSDFAKSVVAVETLKAQLLVEEAKLSKALKERQDAELALNGLTKGEVA